MITETPAAPAVEAPAVAPTPPQPPGMEAARIAIDNAGKKAFEVAAPDVEHVRNADAPPPDAEPEPEPPKETREELLARARIGADRAKRQAAARRREAEEARQAREERDRVTRQLEAERAERERLQTLATKDPMAFLQERGVNAKAIAERAIDDSTPEGQIRALRAQMESERQERLRERQQLEAERAKAATDKAYSDFLAEARDVEAYPTLAKLAKSRPQSLCREGEQVMAEYYRRKGSYPTFNQVLAYLEDEYSKALGDSRPTRDGAQQGRDRTPAQASRPAAAQTITSRVAERAQLPKEVGEMTDAEQVEFFASKLREGARG